MKFYIVYKITNLINEKVYIGRHSTNNINDNYMGSGTELREDMKRVGKKNFSKEILFVFDNWKEMVDKETELLTKEFVNSENTYNATNQGTGLVTHGPAAREKLRIINTGLVSVKDSEGNNLKVKIDDPRYLSGELKHNTFGTIPVKDSNGNKFRVQKDDPRWLSGELVGATTGTKKSREVVEKHIEFMKDFWKTYTRPEESVERIRLANVNRVNVKDNDGNEFRVYCDDPRIKSGELVNASKGSVWINNVELKKSRFIRPEKVQGYLDEGWELGLVYFNKKKRIWIKNLKLNISKQIPETELENGLEEGWELGKIVPIGIGEKIKNGRTRKMKWITNPKTRENKMVYLEFVDDFILNGWKLGKTHKPK